jgi:hypothetical protein
MTFTLLEVLLLTPINLAAVLGLGYLIVRREFMK